MLIKTSPIFNYRISMSINIIIIIIIIIIISSSSSSSSSSISSTAVGYSSKWSHPSKESYQLSTRSIHSELINSEGDQAREPHPSRQKKMKKK
jgi:hypothetical protein